MLRARIAVILVVTFALTGCEAIVRVVRDDAYTKAHQMGGLDDTTLTIATTANPFALRRLVVRHQYAMLDSLFGAWDDSAHRDIRDESYWLSMYDAMENDTALADPLERWTRERPTSAPAFLARAAYLSSQAWAARGTAYARNTPREAMQRMHALVAQANTCIDSALALRPGSPEAYLLLLNIAKVWGDTAAARIYLTKGLADLPASFSLRHKYLGNLVPRWGGSYEAMKMFVDESQAMVEANPRLRTLRGFIYLDQGEVWEMRRQPHEAAEAYDYAFTFGDEWQFHRGRGEMLVRTGRPRDALPDLDAAVAAFPDASSYLWRGMARERIWTSDRSNRSLELSALSDYQYAVVLDPTNLLAAGQFEHLYRMVH